MSSNENLSGAQGREESTRTMQLCDENLAPESPENDKNHIKTPAMAQNLTQHDIRGSPYSAYRSDPLAADAPGEELLPEAAVWSIYKKEATEYDNELVKGRDENLNTMLLFAALFSAILTAFLIESTDLLREDPAETSAALLLLLVQSNLGVTNVSTTLPGSSLFIPESSARWVNGLWFAAFSLSLAATLLAMLAKEWLDAFTASHKRAPYAYAISRQARLDGFEAWGAPHIMDLLPTLLHLSLLLFALGLVVYLWRLDQAIAIMLSFIIGLTSLLYLGTVVCGAVYQSCPFVTRLSRYLQIILQAIARVNAKDCGEHLCERHASSDGGLAVADIRALSWLAGNARDQESGNSAYQALAGLSQRNMKRPPPGKTKRERQELLEGTREVAQFLRDYAARFWSTVTESPQELAKYRGENIIRYAQAIPGIVHCVDIFVGELDPVLDQQRCKHGLIQLRHTADLAMDSTLKVVDEIWSGQCRLSASTYAYVAASELRYIQAMIENEMPHNSPESSSSSQTPTESDKCEVSLDLTNKRRAMFSPAQLWTRYNATLGCASYLIQLHVAQYTRANMMKQHALLDLLKGIETTATFMLKRPPPSREKNVKYSTFVSFNSPLDAESIAHSGLDVRASLNELLRGLLSLSCKLSLSLDVIYASVRAAYTILLLREQDEAHSNGLNLTHLERTPIDLTLDSRKVQSAIADAVMKLVSFVASHDPSSWLFEDVLISLLVAVRNMDSASGEEIQEILEILHSGLDPVMRLATLSMSAWYKVARESLIRLLAFELPDHFVRQYKSKTVWANVFNGAVTTRPYSESDVQKPVSWLLSIIQQSPNCQSEVKTLLSELIERFNEFDGSASNPYYREEWALDHPYLDFFTKSPGFHELVKVRQHAGYASLVAQTVIRLCVNSHSQQAKKMDLRGRLMTRFHRVDYDDLYSDEGSQMVEEYKASPLVLHTQRITPTALPGFLDAVALALDCVQSNKLEDPIDIPEFVECAMNLLNVSLIASHGELDDDCGLKTGKVARRLCEHGAPKLGIVAAGVIAQYGQYCELPMQTDEEVATLEGQSISHTNDKLSSL